MKKQSKKRAGHRSDKKYQFAAWGVSLFLLAGMLLAGQPQTQENAAGSAQPSAGQVQKTNEAAGRTVGDSELTIHFIDVGQGDSTLILCDGEAMLIDAGENDKGVQVQNYLKKQGVDGLKYVIGTHPDADHIGGLDVILYKFDCGTVIMPDKSSDTATYRDVLEAMKSKGYENTLPQVGDTYQLGGAEFMLIAPALEMEDADKNNASVGIRLTHGENTFLFTGDAESKAEAAILETGLDLSATVYKAGHHGSSTSSSPEFLEAVAPKYAVISCGEGNSYGHPHAETLNRFREMGIQVFRTDEQGSVTVTSNGRTLTWNCAPTESWQAGERIGSGK